MGDPTPAGKARLVINEAALPPREATGILLLQVGVGHPKQTTRFRAAATDEIDDRATVPEEFGPLHERFGFTVDVAAAAHNAKCERFYSIEDDGLAQPWAGERVWCNPPYSNIRPWLEKAWYAWNNERAELIVMLLPANRTEQAWWQDLVEPACRGRWPEFGVEFLPGRMRFLRKGQTEIGPKERPPFGCCLLIWGAVS
jgi:phage N-6-adenine-methyltransferase